MERGEMEEGDLPHAITMEEDSFGTSVVGNVEGRDCIIVDGLGWVRVAIEICS
jgi:hypothetical protein